MATYIHTYISNFILNLFQDLISEERVQNKIKHCNPLSLRPAFTLAEVLIVLGIIGIIAQMTIPTLMNNVNDAQYKTGLKVIFSSLNQAITMVKMDNGDSISGLCSTNDSICLVNIFKPYLRSVFEADGVPSSTGLPACWNNKIEMGNASETHACIILENGMAVDFDNENSNCTDTLTCALISVDINGLKSPNKWGKDRYRFYLYSNVLKPISGSCLDGSGTWDLNNACAYKYMYE